VNEVHVGVVGVGRIGAYHASILMGLPGVDKVTVADVAEDRAAQVAADIGAISDSIEGVIAGADAVVITAATSAHTDLIVRSVDAGKPTFCEKPISIDLTSTDRIVDHVKSVGGRVHMGFQRRFDPGYRAAHDLVFSGRLGDLYTVRMAGHDPEPPHEGYIPQSGGIFRDFSVHDFDALRYVTGQEVVNVYADGSVLGFPIFAEYGDVDTGAGLLRLESGALAILSVARHNPLGYDVRMELHGSGDSVVVGWDDRTPIRSLEPGVPPLPGPAYTRFQDRFLTAYQLELGAFLEFAAGNGESPCTVEDAREALRIAVACDISRAEQRPVRLEEVG
jgi:myo-inositol 2-dehydrogenase/D-chiro-inositol 1-dehydrogenase